MNRIRDLEQICEKLKRQKVDLEAKYAKEKVAYREENDSLKNECDMLEAKCAALRTDLSQKERENDSLRAALQNARLSIKIKKIFQSLFYKS